jgi:hypothetical protein
MEFQVPPAAGHPLCHFVPHSLALVSTDPTYGFCLRTLIFGRPTTTMGLVLDIVAISCDAADMMCEEFGRHVNVSNTLYCILQGTVVLLPLL